MSELHTVLSWIQWFVDLVLLVGFLTGRLTWLARDERVVVDE